MKMYPSSLSIAFNVFVTCELWRIKTGSAMIVKLEWKNLLFWNNVFVVSDYDECNPKNSIHAPPCGNNATCINTNTSYDCVCHLGFMKNGAVCAGKYNRYNLRVKIFVKTSLWINLGRLKLLVTHDSKFTDAKELFVNFYFTSIWHLCGFSRMLLFLPPILSFIIKRKIKAQANDFQTRRD